MKIVIISDTHNHHKKLFIPDGDMIIHCGDFTSTGQEHEVESFVNWFGKLDFKYKILIAGNHELTLDYHFYEKNWKMFHKKKVNTQKIKKMVEENPNFFYLKDSSVTIEGIKFYGSPFTSDSDLGWAFPLFNDGDTIAKWSEIPDDTDFLITHTPPEGILDFYQKHLGCDILLVHVLDRIKPFFHCFGHIHSGSGMIKRENITFINASVLGEDYKIDYGPKVIEFNLKKRNE